MKNSYTIIVIHKSQWYKFFSYVVEHKTTVNSIQRDKYIKKNVITSKKK